MEWACNDDVLGLYKGDAARQADNIDGSFAMGILYCGCNGYSI